jgi:hypothetical protein
MTETITAEDYREMYGVKAGRSKYGNRKTEVDGITFDSAAEANRYRELKRMRDAGLICDLELQYPLFFTIDNRTIFKYVSDFFYWDNEKGEHVYEDVKGYATEVYKLKKKLIEAQFRIKITEVRR